MFETFKRFISLSLAMLIGASGINPGMAFAEGLGVEIVALKTEGLVNPLGVETQTPKFSWNYNETDSSLRGFKQSAYRILVASSEANLNADNGDKWDSGKMLGDSTTNILYSGTTLESRKRYFVKVIGYNMQDSAIVSTNSFFEMGLLKNSDWIGAQWIGKRETAPNTVAAQAEKWTNYTVQTDFSIKTACASVIFRAKYATLVHYLVQIEPGFNGTVKLYKGYGSYSLISAFDALKPIASNTTYNIKIVANGSVLTFYLDNALIGSATETSFASGSVGVGAIKTDGTWGEADFDNFKVFTDTATLFEDNFNDSTLNNFQDLLTVGGGKSQPYNGKLKVFATKSLIDVKANLAAPYLRKNFSVSKTVKSARAYVSGIGYYEMSLNGEKVGDRVLEPGYSRYDKTVYYSVYDITSKILSQNAVGFELGRGWYSITTPTLWGEFRAKDWIAEPKVKAMIKIEYTDGTVDSIVTDTNFKTADGPILFDSVKAGEIYDARKEIANWNKTSFDDSGWANAVNVTSPIETGTNLVNAALGKTVTASSSYGDWGWGTAAAVDGIKTSVSSSMGYSSNPSNLNDAIKWVGIDLGTKFVVSKIDLYPRSDQASGYFPSDYNIQVSNDGINFTTVKEIRGSSIDNSVKSNTITPISARYVRIQGINMSGTYLQLAEFEVYADISQNATEIKELTSQMFPPVRVVEEVAAQSITKMNDNTYYVDFGRNMAGNVEMNVSGTSGTKVRLQYAERADSNGTPYIWSFDPASTGCYQQDEYMVKGTGTETYQAKFSYKGFRYIIVSDFPGVPTIANFKAKVINSDMTETGTFDSSSTLLNQISLASQRAIQSNVISIPTDCPTFEKLGWTCDDAAPMEAMAYYYDIMNLYVKRLNDYADDIGADGSISDVLPSTWGLKDSDPAWNGSYIAIAWKMYQYYGDKTILAEHYTNMKKYLDKLTADATKAGNPAYIVNPNEDKGYGDWAPPDHVGGRGPDGVSLYQTVYYYWYTTIMKDIADATGNIADSATFATQATNIKNAINTRYFSEAENAYYFPNRQGGFRQSAQVLPLYFGIVPSGHEQAVADNLAADVVARDNHFWVGILGFEFIADVLMQYGYTDLAYAGNLKNDFPSIGNMIREGATTLWESYSLASTRSLNHKMYSTISEWLFRGVAGLGFDENTKGFKTAIIAPNPGGGLSYAGATYNSAYGTYKSKWTKQANNYIYDVTVPANTTANVKIPKLLANSITIKEGTTTIFDNDAYISGVSGINSLNNYSDYITLNVGSGTYSFTVNTMPLMEDELNDFSKVINHSTDLVVDGGINGDKAIKKTVNTAQSITYSSILQNKSISNFNIKTYGLPDADNRIKVYGSQDGQTFAEIAVNKSAPVPTGAWAWNIYEYTPVVNIPANTYFIKVEIPILNDGTGTPYINNEAWRLLVSKVQLFSSGIEVGQTQMKSAIGASISIERISNSISGIIPNTNITDFSAMLQSETGQIKLMDKNGAEVVNGKVCTGMKAKLFINNAVVDELEIIIYGDVVGDGNVDINDLAAIKTHLLKSQTLSGAFFKAGDIFKKNSITISDLLAVKKQILGLAFINQNPIG